MKTHLLFSVAVVLLCVHANAANSLKVLLKSQEAITYVLTEKPVYWTSASTLFVKSSGLSQEFDLDDVEKISFSDSASGVEFVNSDDTSVYPSLATDAIFVSAPSASEVEVYGDEGYLMSKTQISGSDDVKINVSSWAPGVYIIKVNAKPFKIIKK